MQGGMYVCVCVWSDIADGAEGILRGGEWVFNTRVIEYELVVANKEITKDAYPKKKKIS